MRREKMRFYSGFDEDFSETANQAFTLPEGYRFVRTDLGSRLLSGLIYGAALAFSAVYCRLVLHMRVKGNACLRGAHDGFFIYGNHTQPFGDVFIPALCVFPRRIYTVVSPANYGIPVIGKLLPFLGALPLIPSVHGYRELLRAMEQRLRAGHPIVLYPEAHVWEYYTGIRPFSEVAFGYPVKFDKPVFAMTTTYQKSKWFRRPRMTVWLDGPFVGKGENAKQKAASLHDAVYHTMLKRSKSSSCAYIRYLPKEQPTAGRQEE